MVGKKYIKICWSPEALKDEFGLLGTHPAKICKVQVYQFGLSTCS